ncbi:MAG: bifunctional metallophosphatase/5'-nucleotidase [Desulfuromonadales bacterium]
MVSRIVSLLFLLLLTAACSSRSAGTGHYRLTIAHLNDTHSHLEAVPVSLSIGGLKTIAQVGGFPRLQTVVNEIRNTNPNFLLLHAGDAVQGTLYFTLFNGQVEFDFLNRLGVDAMTFGNHEFDRGTAAIPSYLQRASFPIVSSNIDFSSEPAINSKVPRRIIKELSGQRIGIIGLTTETTPQTTLDVGTAKFNDVLASSQKEIAALEATGINKIIVLSHLGYSEDLKLAAAVRGIDIIVGGHSHSLLGPRESLVSLGLKPDGPYPTEVYSADGGKTLVLQAWQWGHIIGQLDVEFDTAGKISNYTPKSVIPLGDVFARNGTIIEPGSPEFKCIEQELNRSGVARIIHEDPDARTALAPFSAQLESFRTTVVATAAEDLIHDINRGPGPLIADSMMAAVPKAQVAILNYGGVRKDLLSGPVSVGDVLEVMPFANTLVLADLSGEELKNALEEDIDFLLTKFGNVSPPALPYVAGITFTVTMSAAKGNRVGKLMIKGGGDYAPVNLSATYRTVVNAFEAGGGDGFISIRNARGFRTDTGIIDSDAFRSYLNSLGTVRNPAEKRIIVVPNVAPQTASFNYADGYFEAAHYQRAAA